MPDKYLEQPYQYDPPEDVLATLKMHSVMTKKFTIELIMCRFRSMDADTKRRAARTLHAIKSGEFFK